MNFFLYNKFKEYIFIENNWERVVIYIEVVRDSFLFFKFGLWVLGGYRVEGG